MCHVSCWSVANIKIKRMLFFVLSQTFLVEEILRSSFLTSMVAAAFWGLSIINLIACHPTTRVFFFFSFYFGVDNVVSAAANFFASCLVPLGKDWLLYSSPHKTTPNDVMVEIAVVATAANVPRVSMGN